MNFALVDDKKDYILAIFLSPPSLSNLDMTYLNSLSNTFIATMIVILSYMSLFGVTTTLNCFTRTPTLEK